MIRVPSLAKEEWPKAVALYRSGLSMQRVAEAYGTSIDAITYILRKTKTPRRSMREARRIVFENKKPSFKLKNNPSILEEMDIVGAMLYWAEGYKRNTASGVDFANSDPDMILAFWKFLKYRYILDRKRLHFSVYYYEDQDLPALVRFWSKKLGLSSELFKNSYCKSNPKPNARKLTHGVLHIRYTDKKLLWDVLNLIESCKVRLRVGGGAV